MEDSKSKNNLVEVLNADALPVEGKTNVEYLCLNNSQRYLWDTATKKYVITTAFISELSTKITELTVETERMNTTIETINTAIETINATILTMQADIEALQPPEG